MKRFISTLIIMLILGFGMIVQPTRAEAAKSCVDSYFVCLNNASDYTGGWRTAAETECGIEYGSCLASKLKFW